MQQNVAELLLAITRTRFDDQVKAAGQGLTGGHPGANPFIFRRFI
jgi:hypothetical protein